MKRFTLLSLVLLLTAVLQVQAQWSIDAVSTAHQINFDLTVTGVNNAAFATTGAQPMFASPTIAGQLDANAWTYVKDGAVDTAAAVYPGTGNADIATVTAAGTSATGWGAWDLSGNHAFGLLASGSNGTGGNLTLMCTNNTGQTIEGLDLSYYVAAYNDQPRANKVDFLYSFDNITWTRVPAISFLSGAAATTSWESATRTLNLTGLLISNGSNFYLRWHFNDVSGTGSRDEFLLDDISLTATGGNPTAASQLDIIGVNGGNAVSAGTPFNVVVQAKNSLGQIANVDVDKVVTLSIQSGAGVLGGTLTGTILAGTNTVTISGVTYSIPETEVELLASASGLTAGDSDPFDVLEAASKLVFTAVPTQATAGALLGTITVEARRADQSLDLNFNGNITLLPFNGTFTIGGTTTKTAQGGICSFSDLFIQYPGSYQIAALSFQMIADTTDPILIVQGPEMTEVVVPQYIGSKSASTANNCRTPYAVCLSFQYLLPNTAYDVRIGTALTSEANSSFGAGNSWNGTAFAGANLTNYFTTDANGTATQVWFYLQPTGNASRFDAGMVHNLRVGIIPNGGIMPTSPTFVGTKTITALDIPTTARTLATTDDGAFVTGTLDAAYSGAYFFLYSNEAGTGDPMYCYQVRQTNATQAANSDLPLHVDSVWRQLAGTQTGDWAAVIPIGANNPDGIRRIELRDAQNVILHAFTDDDGVWPGGGNTLTAARRDVVFINAEPAITTITISGQITYANTASTPMDSTTVYLMGDGGFQISTYTDSQGNYSFENVAPGTYTLSAGTNKYAGGWNAVDALLALRHFVGLATLNGIYLLAGDATGDGYVNAVDALSIQKRFVSLITTFDAGNWRFETKAVTVDVPAIYPVNFKGCCTGDPNGSFIPW